MNTGEIIKNRRKELGMTADSLADALGLNRSTVFRYEKGDIEKVPAYLIPIIAKALRCTPGYLMGWEDDPNARRTIPAAADAFYVKYAMLDEADREFVSRTVDGLLAAEKYRAKKDMNA